MAPQAFGDPFPEGRFSGVLERVIRQLALDVLLELVAVPVTAGRVGLQAAADDGFHGRADRPIEPAEAWRRFLPQPDEAVDQFDSGTPHSGRGAMPRQQLEEDDSQRVEIAPTVDLS